MGERICALALDSQGAATTIGSTNSSNFPTTPGAFDTSFNGGSIDAFVTKLAPSGSSLVYSTFLGGTGADAAGAFVLDAQGAATILLSTTSATLPTTPNAFDRTFNGNTDAFVACLDMLPTGVVRYGKSTAACQGPMAIDVTRMPQSGDSKFTVTCAQAPPNTTGFLLLGAGQHLRGLPILGM